MYNYLLIIDGSALLTTQYYGCPPLKTAEGVNTNAVFGFMKCLMSILREQCPKYIAVTWDIAKNRNTFRREMYRYYKANRKDKPVELKEQFITCQNLLSALGIPQFMDERFEADDFSGSLCKKFEEEVPVRILTKDRDYLQLVSERTNLWLMYGTNDAVQNLFSKYNMNSSEYKLPYKTFKYSPNFVEQEFGVPPESICDLKALIGDVGDNIPGIKGCGENSAVPLISYYKTVEELYKNIRGLNSKEIKELNSFWKENLGIKRSPINNLLANKLEEDDIEFLKNASNAEYYEYFKEIPKGEASAILSKKLAIIKTDIEIKATIEDLKLKINKDTWNKEFKKLEFNSLYI